MATDAHDPATLSERLHRTLEAMSDAFFLLGPDWTFQYVNAEAERVLERRRAELLGRVIWDEFPGAVGTIFETTYREAVATGTPRQFITFYAPLNRWLDVRAFPSPDGLAIYFRDVTQQHHDEQTRRLQAVALDSAANAFVITNRDGVIEWFNPAFANSYGFTADEVLGRKPGDVIGSGQHDPTFFSEMWDTISDGNVWAGEIINRKKDGSLLTEEMTITPMRDEQGIVTHFVAVKQDVTARNEAHRRIREQAALIEQASDAIVVCSLDGAILFWNAGAETLYGWDRTEAIGRSVVELLNQPCVVFDDAMAGLMRDDAWMGEMEQVTRDGRSLVVQSRWTLLRDDENGPQAVLKVNSDVTEQRRLEKQANRSQRVESIGTLAGGIAHDLNNALAPVLIGIELLQNGETDTERLATLKRMQRSAERGAGLVRQVVTFAQGQDGIKRPLHVADIVHDAQTLLEAGLQSNITIRVDTAPHTHTVMADPTQLQQVLMNLSVNAIDAMPDGGTLWIRVRTVEIDARALATHALSTDDACAPGTYVLLSVGDEGTGIPEDVLDRLFDPFYTTKDFGEGTGLGLSTSLGIVRRHGGFMDVHSKEGHGSTFDVYVPAYIPDADG